MPRLRLQTTIRRNRLPRLSGAVRAQASAAVRETAYAVEARAKQVVPVRTGNLRNSIQTDAEPGALRATVGTGVDYAIYVEYGASGRPPRPYLTPAAEAERPEFARRMRALLGDL